MSHSTSQPSRQTAVLEPEQWVDAYGDYLFRYAVSRLRNAGDAEEVVQETLLAGIANHQQFVGNGTQIGWLLGILKRKIIDHLRDRSKRQFQTANDDFDPTALLFDENGQWKAGSLPTIAPDKEFELKELWGLVQDCLKSLPAKHADVFVLSVMEGMEVPEICKELEITSSNLWVRLHRARLGLAKCVGSKGFFDDEGGAGQ
ncbi:sigma-70 family RNA polymerase sigma factor [Aureliella helgolandensis]|uniref:ECF RNA polymerase sigma factor SigE n=1 Tax=Aureliella helgolandensis TaxID=2527968 RepID=A0A518GH84_9BACT|nr:sigma-70 family RNA polymerase sigma factor [Aureliella helgolandensis]QDV27952.1 ECF RNA polymerase sigma factor SigE [Aureliella helgolandensis]